MQGKHHPVVSISFNLLSYFPVERIIYIVVKSKALHTGVSKSALLTSRNNKSKSEIHSSFAARKNGSATAWEKKKMKRYLLLRARPSNIHYEFPSFMRKLYTVCIRKRIP